MHLKVLIVITNLLAVVACLALHERDSATPQNLLITSGSSANGFMCSGPESCKNFMM